MQEEHLGAAIMADVTRKQNLNSQRPHRTYPRAVKRARHNSYRVKRASDQGTCHTGPSAIKLINLRIYRLAT